MASAFPVLLVLFVVLGLMATSWFSVRKGPHQTCAYPHSTSTAQPLWTHYQPSTQTHPHQPVANSYMLLLDVGHSILGTATSSRRYAAICVSFSQRAHPSHPDLMVYCHILIFSSEGESCAGALRCNAVRKDAEGGSILKYVAGPMLSRIWGSRLFSVTQCGLSYSVYHTLAAM